MDPLVNSGHKKLEQHYILVDLLPVLLCTSLHIPKSSQSRSFIHFLLSLVIHHTSLGHRWMHSGSIVAYHGGLLWLHLDAFVAAEAVGWMPCRPISRPSQL
jgi:hypothetical protein